MRCSDGAVSVVKIAKVMGVTERYVNKRAKKEGWKFDVVNKRGDKRFTVEGLPADVRMKLGAGDPASSPTTPGQARPAVARPGIVNQGLPIYKGIARSVPVGVGSPELADWQNRIALARADLIRTYLQEKGRAKDKRRSVVEASDIFIKGFNTGQLLPRVFETLGVTARQTVDAWVKKFRDGNYDYTVLSPRWGNRKGKRKITDEEFNVLLSFSLHPNRLRVSETVRMTKMAMKRKGIPSPSSKDTLRRALMDWKKRHYDQWVFCREGEKALNDKCLPYIERDAGLLDVGEVLVADGHTLNFQILHPYTGKPCRMTMIMWYDWASCMPAGWEIMPTENIQCVAAGLRRAIIRLGKMPKVVYLDNGKAFRAKIFTDTSIDFEEAGFYGMFARLGMETIFAWPYNAQAKPVERFFGTFGELERLMPTYTGASIKDKPAHMLRNEKLHRKLHEKKYGGWIPTIQEANGIIAAWVNEYSGRPHRGLKGLAPGELFKSGIGPGVDEKALRYLMMSMEPKGIPGRNGVRFMSRDYYDDALYGYRDRVMIRYDMEDLSKIYVYDRSGARLICEAVARSPVHPVAKITGKKEDLALVRAGIKQKRGLKKATEAVARAYVEGAPALVAIPERVWGRRGEDEKVRSSFPSSVAEPLRRTGAKASEDRGGGNRGARLTRAEAERIEEEASKMTVIELRPKEPDPVFMSEPDRYEALLERECKGEELPLDDMTFMRYFEKTKIYRQLKERFEFLWELWMEGRENSCGFPPARE